MCVALHPPSAHQYLYEKDGDEKQCAGCIAEVEMKSPVIEYERAYDALADIVGEAHAAVGHDETHGAAEACGVEGEEEGCDDDEHEAAFV